MRLLTAIVLLVGLAESRSVQVDLMSLVKNVASNGGGARTNDASLLNSAPGEADGQDSNVGFILFGNVEDLEKYKMKLNYNVDNNKAESGFKVNTANMIKENIKDLVENSRILEETDDNDGNKESGDGQVEDVKNKKHSNKFVFKHLSDYNEDDDSEDYENSDEAKGKGNKVDVFSEDEYNDYDEGEESAEEVSSEEDESEEEKFYDEDEKYYEDEENQFENIEDKSPFDGIFIEYN